MKLVEDRSGVVVEAGGAKSMAMEIDASNTGILFSILSENLYSDIYGSIIRELVSNAWDANKEAGSTDKPVYVHFNGPTETEDAHIKIVDCGPGISEDRVEKIYGKYLASSKRDSNEQIGGWGLGSKTPLAYTDHFHITTVHNGMKYLYIMRKGVSNTILELMYSAHTDLANGTEIKIYLKDPAVDILKFFKAAHEQLMFFNNVLLVCNEEALELQASRYSGSLDIEEFSVFNKKKIYYFNKFVVVTDEGNYNHQSILLGQVKYPFPKEVDSSSLNNCELAIRFDIGELPVTPSREGILWTPAALTTFKQRYVEAVLEMQTIISKQKAQPVGYVEYVTSSSNDRKIKITDEFTINLGSSAHNNTFESEYNEITGNNVSLYSSPNCKYLTSSPLSATIFSTKEFETVLQTLLHFKNKYWCCHSSKLRELKWNRKTIIDLLKDGSQGKGRYYSFDTDTVNIKREVIVQNPDKFKGRDHTYFFTKKYNDPYYYKKGYKAFIEWYNAHNSKINPAYTCKELYKLIVLDISNSCNKFPEFNSLTFSKAAAKAKVTVAPDSISYNICKTTNNYGMNYKEEKGTTYDIHVFKTMQGIVVKKGELEGFKAFFCSREDKALKVYSIADSKFEKYKSLLKNPMSKEKYSRRIADACTLYQFFQSIEKGSHAGPWVKEFYNNRKFLTNIDAVERVLQEFSDKFNDDGWRGIKPKCYKDGTWKVPYLLKPLAEFYEENGWLNQELFRNLQSVHEQMNLLDFTQYISSDGADHPVIKKMITSIMLDSPTLTRKQKINLLTQKFKNN